MFTTKGLKAAALVRLMTSPSPLAACSFNSGVPLRIPSRNIGRIGAIPWQELIKHEYKHNEYHSQKTYRGMSEKHTMYYTERAAAKQKSLFAISTII